MCVPGLFANVPKKCQVSGKYPIKMIGLKTFAQPIICQWQIPYNLTNRTDCDNVIASVNKLNPACVASAEIERDATSIHNIGFASFH